MNPQRLYATNYRTFERLDLDLPEGVTAIVGPNGSGKSSIVNLIDLVPFGSRSLNAHLANDGSDERMELGVEFAHAGESYRVRRHYSAAGRGKSALDFERLEGHDYTDPGNAHVDPDDGAYAVAWMPLTRESATETQQLIEETIGLSRTTFRASSFLGQGDAAAFTEASPRDRKSILAELLSLDVWERLLERTRVDKLSTQTAVDQAHGRIAQAEQELHDRTKLEAERDAKVADLAAAEQGLAGAEQRLVTLQAELAGAIEERAGYQAAADSLTAAQSRLSGVRSEWEDRIARARQNVERVEREQRETEGAIEEAQRQSEKHSGIIVQVRERLDGIKHGEAPKCPTCTQELGDKRDLAIRVVSDELEVRESEHAALAERITDLQARRAGIDAAVARNELHLTHATAQEKIAEAESAVTDAERQVGALVDVEQRYRAAEDTARIATAAANSQRHAVKDLEIGVAKLDTALERLAALAEQVESARSEIAGYEKELTLLTALEKAFGRDGIPALIVENAAIPSIETEANRILTELGTDFRVELRTQRALKSGDGVREALDIVVCTPSGEREFETYSGGERSRINVALRIALARLLANRRGAESRILVLDELEFLDEAGQEALAGVLRGLQDTFARVIVVSHHPVLREAFDQVIEVAKDENGHSYLVGQGEPHGSPVGSEAVAA